MMTTDTLLGCCTHCQSKNLVKNGKTKSGKQKYRCKDCGTYGTLNPSIKYPPECQTEILRAYHNGSSLRGLKETFGVTYATVSKWLKQEALNPSASLPSLAEEMFEDNLEQDDTVPRLRIHLLGTPRIQLDGTSLTIPSKKGLALLAFLAVTGERHHRAELVALLWPELDHEHGRANLRRVLVDLKTVIGEGWLTEGQPSIKLNQPAPGALWVDVLAFHYLLEPCQAHKHPDTAVCSHCLPLLHKAAKLYRGDFLAGLSVYNSVAFDEWQMQQTEQFRQKQGQTLARLVTGHSQVGQLETAVIYAEHWRDHDPLHEPAVRQLMQLYTQTEQRAKAIKVYQDHVHLLNEELGVGPEKETTVLYNYIYQENQPLQDQDLSNQIRLTSFRSHNAPFMAPPLPARKLVGRDKLLQNIKRQVFNKNQQTTISLYGLPGIGKTSLMVSLAHDPDILSHFTDGILWAGLGRTPDILAHLGAWGTALEIADINQLITIEERVRAIHTRIGMKRMVLVIDDVWQLETALTFKLGGPNCLLLLTTRSPEIALEFAGSNTISVNELDETEGLALLRQFIPDVVTQIKHELQLLIQAVGGLPLALTLMGKYLRREDSWNKPERLQLALKQLQQTKKRFELQEHLSPLERHPSLPMGTSLSLRASIHMSVEQLSVSTHRVLQALSLLPAKPNTFSQEAALAIAATSEEALDTLIDASLMETSGTTRYMIHQTIADYARIELSNSDTYERIVSFFIDYIHKHRLEHNLLAQEIENILAMLQIAFKQNMKTALAQGSNALISFWQSHGLYEIAEIHLKRAYQVLDNLSEDRTSTLDSLGRIAMERGNYEEAKAYFREGLSLAHKQKNYKHISHLLHGLGLVAQKQGKYDQAEKCFHKGLYWAYESEDTALITRFLQSLGVIANNQGDYATAQELYQQGLDIARETNHYERIVTLLMDLGVIANYQGKYAVSEMYYQEALQLAEQMEYQNEACTLYMNLGVLAGNQGRNDQAEIYFRESLTLARNLENQVRICSLLTNLGALAIQLENYSQAENYLDEGLVLARKLNHQQKITGLLLYLGQLSTLIEEETLAKTYFQEGLALARGMDNLWLISSILIKWGDLYLKQQEWGSAYEVFQESLHLAKKMKVQDLIAEALFGLAKTSLTQGRNDDAYRQGQRSLQIFELLNHFKASEVQKWLSKLAFFNNQSSQQNLP